MKCYRDLIFSLLRNKYKIYTVSIYYNEKDFINIAIGSARQICNVYVPYELMNKPAELCDIRRIKVYAYKDNIR